MCADRLKVSHFCHLARKTDAVPSQNTNRPCVHKSHLMVLVGVRCVMKWMRERDLLIAQTMAFVQSVTGKKPDADKLFANAHPLATGEAVDAPASFMPDLEGLLADTTVTAPLPKPAQVARPDARVDFQSEIRARVANFRAHQERFN